VIILLDERSKHQKGERQMKLDALDIVGIIGLVFLLAILAGWALRDKSGHVPSICPMGFVE
jgi:hypothetical protein